MRIVFSLREVRESLLRFFGSQLQSGRYGAVGLGEISKVRNLKAFVVGVIRTADGHFYQHCEREIFPLLAVFGEAPLGKGADDGSGRVTMDETENGSPEGSMSSSTSATSTV